MKANRADRRNQLRAMSKQRQNRQGAPDFGVTEEKLARMMIEHQQLIESNNKMARQLDEITKNRVIERAAEAHYMTSTIIAILIEKNICTEEQIQKISEAVQMEDIGLADKENGVVEEGDHLIMRFKLFYEDKMVDDQTQSPLAYIVGSKQLSCDDGFVGMKVGETRYLDVTFKQGFKFPEYVGKPLKMQVTCGGIKVAKKPESKEQSLNS